MYLSLNAQLYLCNNLSNAFAHGMLCGSRAVCRYKKDSLIRDWIGVTGKIIRH